MMSFFSSKKKQLDSAVVFESYENVKTLIENGVSVSLANIHKALERGQEDIANLLLEHSSDDVSFFNSILADDYDSVLKRMNVEPDIMKHADSDQGYYFLLAVRNKKYNAAIAFLDFGIDLANQNKSSLDENSPEFIVRCVLGADEPSIIDIIIEGTCTSFNNSSDYNQARSTLLQRLVDIGFEKSPSVMATLGSISGVKTYVENHTDFLTSLGDSGFFEEGEPVCEEFICAVSHNHFNLVKYYLDVGVSANCVESPERISTALLRAVQNNNKEIVQLLLDNGADPTVQNMAWYTPLEAARRQSNEEIMKLLLPYLDEKAIELIKEDLPDTEQILRDKDDK